MTDSGQDAAGDVFRTTVHAAGRSRVNYVGKGNLNFTVLDVGARSAHPPSVDPPERGPLRHIRGRDDLLGELTSAMIRSDGRPWVLHGIGGGGKSAVALQLVQVARNHGRDVYWIPGGDITQAMLTVAERRGVDPDTVLRARANWQQPHDLVWASLNQTDRPWLLIFDNVDDPAALGGAEGNPGDGTGWLRPSSAGLTVVTSRYGEEGIWGEGTVLRRVRPLDADVGADVLMDLAPDAGPAQDAQAVAQRLGGLPLALRLAGSYLAGDPLRHRTFAEYRRALDTDLLDLIDRGEPLPVSADNDESARRSVRATWELSLRLLAEKGLAPARPLLRMLSCFGAPHPLRHELLNADLLQGTLVDCGREALTSGYLDQVMGGLVAVALLDRQRIPGPATGEQHDGGNIECVVLHPLVAEVIAATLDEGARHDEIWELAQTALLAISPEDAVSPQQWQAWATLPAVHASMLERFPAHLTDALADAVTVAGFCALHLSAGGELRTSHEISQLAVRRSGSLPPDHPARLVVRLFAVLINRGEGNLAPLEGELRALLADAERMCPPEDLLLPAIRQNLTMVLADLGRLTEAETLFADVLADYQHAGVDLPLSLRCWHAQLLSQRGELERAEHELRAVVEAEQEELGPEHPETLMVRASLGDVLVARGQLNEAQRELEAVLRIQERLFGIDSPVTLAARTTLMGLLAVRGDLGAARNQLHQLLRIQRDALNPEHPLALLGLATLTSFQVADHGPDEAIAAERQVRDVCEAMTRTLGHDHPLVLGARLQAAIQRRVHDPAGAEAEWAEIAEAQTAVHGAEHPATLTTRLLRTLAICERDSAAGEDALLELHATQLRAFGDDHPQTVQVRQTLAHLAYQHGDLDAAEAHLWAALTGLEGLNGADHEDTQEIRVVLAGVLFERRDFARAEEQLRILIGSVERTAGPQTEEALSARVMLAALRRSRHDLTGAERELVDVLAILRTEYEPDHGGTLIVQSMLGELLRHQSGRFPEAERYLRTALAGLERGWGEDDEDALAVRVELGELLHESGDLHGAEEHLQVAMARLRNADEPNRPAMARVANSLATVSAELGAQTSMPTTPAVPAGSEIARIEAVQDGPFDAVTAWRLFIDGDLIRAQAAFIALREQLGKTAGPADITTLDVGYGLACTLSAAGRGQEAAAEYRDLLATTEMAAAEGTAIPGDRWLSHLRQTLDQVAAPPGDSRCRTEPAS